MKTMILAFLQIAVCAVAAHASEFHVAKNGNDASLGSSAAPLLTIQRAADLAQPGDTIIVHQGVYRERVDPPRGGRSDRERIVYQALQGEHVEIKGSEVVKGWVKVQGNVWKVTLPNSFFGSFNPYNDRIHGDWFDRRGRDHHTGAVYLNGDWLTEAANLNDLMMPEGSTPEWLSGAGGPYLLNVAWVQAGKGSAHPMRIPATDLAARHGTRNAPCSEGGECLGFISHGDWVRYKPVDFGKQADSLRDSRGVGRDGRRHRDSPGRPRR